MKKVFIFISFIFLLTLSGCFANSIHISSDLEELPEEINITIAADNKIMLIGETQQLRASADLEGALFSWRSMSVDIMSVSNNGVVLALSIGTATIQAILIQNETIRANFLIEVVESPESISITGPTEANADEMFGLSASISPSGSYQKVLWSSSDESKAVVANGFVRTIAEGEVMIKATSSANKLIFSEYAITILPAIVPTALTLESSMEIFLNQTKKAFVSVSPSNASKKAIWSSSDETIVYVDQSGQVYAKGVGSAVVSVKSIYNEAVFSTINITCSANTSSAFALEEQIQTVIENSLQALVGISNYQMTTTTNTLFLHSKGSGVIYKAMIVTNEFKIVEYDASFDETEIKEYLYYVATNRHVIENAANLKVYIGSKDKDYPAALVAFDDKTDFAVISFRFNEYFEPLLFADTSGIKAGSFVISLGCPNGFEYYGSATLGIVSYSKRYMNDDLDGDGVGDWHSEYIQHDGAINHGNSGGPLLNLTGEIIGLNTLKMVSNNVELMGFAIPSHVIKALLPVIEDGKTPVRAALGLVGSSVKDLLERDDELYEIPEGIEYGVYVTVVNPNTVSAAAGLEVGDVVLIFNNVELLYIHQIRAELGKIVVGNNEIITAKVYKKISGQIETIEFIFP